MSYTKEKQKKQLQILTILFGTISFVKDYLNHTFAGEKSDTCGDNYDSKIGGFNTLPVFVPILTYVNITAQQDLCTNLQLHALFQSYIEFRVNFLSTGLNI